MNMVHFSVLNSAPISSLHIFNVCIRYSHSFLIFVKMLMSFASIRWVISSCKFVATRARVWNWVTLLLYQRVIAEVRFPWINNISYHWDFSHQRWLVFLWLSLGLVVWPRLGDPFVFQDPRELCVSYYFGRVPGCSYDYFTHLRVTHTRVSWRISAAVWVIVILLSPGHVLVFWPITTLLFFR